MSGVASTEANRDASVSSCYYTERLEIEIQKLTLKMVKGTEAVTEYQPLLSDSNMKLPNKSLLLAICAVGIGGSFQCGYNMSIMNAPTKSIQNFINQTWLGRYEIDITEHMLTLLWSIIVSIFTLGGLIGATFGGKLAIKLGRKGALLINNTFALLAALLMGLSYPSGVYELLIVGRFLSGINAGVGVCVQPLYLGEIAPRAFRGAVAMGTSIFITGGILVGQVIGLKELLGRDDLWPVLLSTTSIPAMMQLLILPWFPESPRYLLIERGDSDACTNALRWLHGQQDYSAEWEDMERERISSQGQEPMSPWQLVRNPTLRWQLTTSVLLNGINAIYFYASYVFGQSGIPASKIPYVTLGTGACECLTALTCGMLIESLGRRVLIIGGYSLMTFWCACLTLTLTLQDISPLVPYLSMACVFAFILSFGLGPGGVTNILNGELFTQTSRSAAYMIGGSINWLSLFIIGILFPFIVNGLMQYCFLVFLVICCVVATYIFFMVPETKNKTFLEIQAEFQSKYERKNKTRNSRGAGITLCSVSR
ncbi:solute carrier family 2, facilitated glucose transporter member 11b [Brienomyrus brachyistius]|uniref:solute carrier family 2, facilitated glucose transporter member 11b n=1 Tax=Brienomyrus brachyistius TaxID=42636 RepID=UPI0020B2002A|nr:solute carrier family 2, facilitated glucose transporter member 11b [Brienomyrus brachyistius]